MIYRINLKLFHCYALLIDFTAYLVFLEKGDKLLFFVNNTDFF